jgi:hypothetical protein
MGYVLAISNKIRIAANECNTKVIKFKDDRDSYGVNYSDDPTFYQQIRLHLNLTNPKPVVKEKIYRETGGNYRFGNVILDKQYDLLTDQFDEPTSFALQAALKHSDFYIDEVAYLSSGILDLTENEFNNLLSGKATVFKQGYNQTNIQC